MKRRVHACGALAALALAATGCGDSSPTALPAPSLMALARTSHSLRLTIRPPAKVRAACAAARRQHVSVPVLCPTLVPAGPVGGVPGIRDDELWGPIVFPEDLDLYQLSFNNGTIRDRQHWIVGAGHRAVVRRLVIDGVENEQARPARLLATRTVGGRAIRVYRFPDPGGGAHAGHVAGFATRGDVVVFASIHGYRHADAAVAMTAALALAPVSP